MATPVREQLALTTLEARGVNKAFGDALSGIEKNRCQLANVVRWTLFFSERIVSTFKSF